MKIKTPPFPFLFIGTSLKCNSPPTEKKSLFLGVFTTKKEKE